MDNLGLAKSTPVYTDTFALSAWLLGQLDKDPRPLARALCGNVLRLLEAVTLAAKHRAVDARLEEADERLIVLRTQLRLAAARRTLSENQALFALDAADRIGRQVGGWLKSLGSA